MIALYPFQEEAVHAISACKRGIVKAPAGAGKTLIAAAAIHRFQMHGLGYNILWLANTREQIEQAEKACDTMGVNEACVTFKCYQAAESAKAYDLVVSDECHHVPAPIFRKWFAGHEGARWGFSATPDRGDELTDDVFELIGPVVYEIAREPLVKAGLLSRAEVEFFCPNDTQELQDTIELTTETRFKKMERSLPYIVAQMDKLPLCKIVQMQTIAVKKEAILLAEQHGLEFEDPVCKLRARLANTGPQISHVRSWLMQSAKQELMSRARWQAALQHGIYENIKRNEKIVDLALAQTATTLVLVGKVTHGEALSKQVPGSIVVHSRMKGRKDAVESLRDGRTKVAFVTSLLDEGADIPRASVLILAAAGRSARQQEQRTGRVLRTFAEKTHGKIIDFWDVQHPMLLRQSKARAKIYSGLGYEWVGTPDVVSKVFHAIGVTINKAIGFGKKK